MDAVVASMIAVVGTLAGAALTFVFGLVTARRSQRAAQAERLRQELQAACAAFAGAASVMRRRANDRWYRQYEKAEDRVLLASADAFYDARNDAWTAYYRLLLAGAGIELATLAEGVIEAADAIVHAADKTREHHQRERVAELITGFVSSAAVRVQADAFAPMAPQPPSPAGRGTEIAPS